MTEGRTAYMVSFEVAPSMPSQSKVDHFSGGATKAIANLKELDFADVSRSISRLVEELAFSFKPREGGPAECEVEFAVKVTAEGSLVVSKLGGEVSMHIKVKWDRK